MTFAFAWRALRRHLVLILVTAVVIAGAGVALGTYWPKTYSSKAQILLGIDIAGANTDPQTANLYLKDRAMTYAQLVIADEVINPVAAELGTDAVSVRERVVGSIVPETVVLGVSASGSTPEEAVALTQAVTTSFMTQVSSLNVQTGGPAILPAQLASPQPATVPDQLHGKLLVAVSAFAGLLVGVLLALVVGLVEAGRAARREEKQHQRRAAAAARTPDEPAAVLSEAAMVEELPQAANGTDRRGRTPYLTINTNNGATNGLPQRRDRARERGTASSSEFGRHAGHRVSQDR